MEEVLNLTKYFSKQLLEKKIDGLANALICEATSSCISFTELELKSTKLASVIHNLILRRDANQSQDEQILDPVIGVRMQPTIDLVVCLMAILKCGVAYVPIGSGAGVPVNRIKHIVQDCKPLGIISDLDSDNSQRNTCYACPSWHIRELLDYNCQELIGEGNAKLIGENCNGANNQAPKFDQDIAVILYTSGSTGVPKGVRISHASIMNRLIWQWKKFPFQKDEKCCLKTSITFGDSVAEIFAPLLQGIPIVVLPMSVVSQPDVLIKSLWKHQITRIVLVPSLLQSILKTLELFQSPLSELESCTLDNCSLNLLRLWVCSGEALPVDLLREFFRRFPKDVMICNFYGSTEVTFDVTFETFKSLADVEDKIDCRGSVPIGEKLTNSEIWILNEALEEVKNGEIGELFVAGTVLADGYVGHDTSDKFLSIPNLSERKQTRVFRTGDLVQISQSMNGKLNLFYKGRKGNQIKVRGHRVDLSEIGMALNKIDTVDNSVVLCFEPGTQEQKILAFVVTSEDAANVKKTLEMHLENFQMPILIPIHEIPLLVNGKTDTQNLLNFYKNKMKNGVISDREHKCTDLATTVIQCLSDVLLVPMNHIIDNLNETFYSIGGTSLNTVLAVLRLRESGIEISILDFLTMKSIGELIECIQLKRQKNPGIRNGISNQKINLVNCAEMIHGVRSDYIIEPLKLEFKDYLLKMISYGEANRGDLEILVKPTEQDVTDWLNATYDFFVEVGLSFVVKRVSDNTIVASALNRGLTNQSPHFTPSKKHAYVFDYLTLIDASQIHSLPCALHKVFRSGPINTARGISPDENVVLIKLVEEHNISLAKSKGFHGILSTNLNPLTQQVTRDLLGYSVLVDLQVNKYQAKDGTWPFAEAADEQRAICCFKSLDPAKSGELISPTEGG